MVRGCMGGVAREGVVREESGQLSQREEGDWKGKARYTVGRSSCVQKTLGDPEVGGGQTRGL